MNQESIRDALLAAIENSGESLNSIAEQSGVSNPILYRFVSGERRDIRVSTAEKLAAYLGLALRPVDGKRKSR